MNISQSFKMAFKSIIAKKGRSVLTMLGIIIGIASVMTIVSVVSGYNKKTMAAFNSMGTNKVNVYASRYDGTPIFDGLYDYCLRMSDIVDGITPEGNMWSNNVRYGTRSSSSMQPQPQLYLGSDKYSICNNFTIERGRDISFIDVDEYGQVCVMGARAAKAFFDYTDPIGKRITVDGIPFTVIGVYKEKDPDSDWSMDNMIVFPYTSSRYMINRGDMSSFIIKARDKESVNEIITRVDGYLSRTIGTEKGWYNVYSNNQYIEESSELANTMSLVLGGIAFISLLVGGIGIMNIMLVTVAERTREIGIRRAIGAPRASIVMQFLIEAAMICGIGGFIGIGIGFLGTLIAGKLIVHMVLLPSVIITGGSFIFSVILGVIFGLYPAIKASGLLPVVALRAE